MLFKNLFDAQLYEHYLIEKKNLAQTSRYLYVQTIEKFISESKDLIDIDSYNRFIIKYGIKKRSNYVYSVLKSFIEYYVDDAATRTILIENLIKPEIPSNIKRERKYLEEEEIIGIINNMKHMKHKVIALIQDLTGVRAGDVLKIVRGNIIPEIYEEKNVLRIIIEGKGKKRNVVFIHDDMVQTLIIDYIIKNINDTGYYFLDHKKAITDMNYMERKLHISNYKKYYKDLKQAMYRLGIDFKSFATHDYRRCYARRAWSRYKDAHVLQELLNHQNPATTMRYLKQSGMQNIDYHREMQNG
ncbi:MAG: tyrosine-type recombinase/integrase [bacterium]